MKFDKSIIWSFTLLVIVASLYKIMPNRPWGFAPQIAMAIFAGSIVKDKKWSFLLPLASMFLSDLLFEVLYRYSVVDLKGFYNGQITNYILFTGLTVFGFFVNSKKPFSILIASLAAPTAYFLISNFMVWVMGGGLYRPKTFDGLMMCYTDALPFL
ncbi:MAG: hypothetical protein IPJ81_08090 [Chitinophagaceae bacterium]|nr:hypothetical protein [Chitinophagaceae bacterium]